MLKKLSKFDQHFIKDCDENSNKGYFPEVDVEYPKKLFSGAVLGGTGFNEVAVNGAALNLHRDLPFLPERNKIKKCKKLVCNIYDKENYVGHTRALIQALNHRLILKKVHRVIQFNQEAWLKQYIDMNTKLRTEAKNDFEKKNFN